jgi:hypothetical protein
MLSKRDSNLHRSLSLIASEEDGAQSSKLYFSQSLRTIAAQRSRKLMQVLVPDLAQTFCVYFHAQLGALLRSFLFSLAGLNKPTSIFNLQLLYLQYY